MFMAERPLCKALLDKSEDAKPDRPACMCAAELGQALHVLKDGIEGRR